MTAGNPELPPLAAGPRPAAGWSLVRAGLVVAPAMAVANGLNYAYNVVMARLLGPSGYGALGALLALVVIGTVPGYALQAVVARHTALRAPPAAGRAGTPGARRAELPRVGPAERPEAREALADLWSRTLATVVGVAVGLGLVTVAAGPWLSGYLRLGSLVPALWLAAAVAPLPVLAAVQGMLQGRERFTALAAVLLVAAAGKLAVGAGLVRAGGGVSGALAGAAVGSVLAMLLALACVRPALATVGAAGGRWRPAGWWRPAVGRLLPLRIGREVVGAAVAILGLLLLANVDVLLARHYLDGDGSGLYAAGAVVTKIAYWAPQFVVTIVFPRLCTTGDRRRLLGGAAAAMAGFGGLLVAGAAAAPHLAATLPFGQAYLEAGPALPLFAALGTCLALVQLVLFSGIATADPRLNGMLLAAVVAEMALGTLVLHGSVAQIVGLALAVAGTVLATGWLVERGRNAGPGP